jgi:hypothetical protein
VQRALAAFFRLCGLMQLAGLLRNSLPVICAAWVCLVRPAAARPRRARLQSAARACGSSRCPRCVGRWLCADALSRVTQVVAGCAGAASHFALVPAASASVLASAATAVVYLLVGLPEARPAFASLGSSSRRDTTQPSFARGHF